MRYWIPIQMPWCMNLGVDSSASTYNYQIQPATMVLQLTWKSRSISPHEYFSWDGYFWLQNFFSNTIAKAPLHTISALPYQEVSSRHVWDWLSNHAELVPLNLELAPSMKTGLYPPQTGVQLMAPPNLWYPSQTRVLLVTSPELQPHPSLHSVTLSLMGV